MPSPYLDAQKIGELVALEGRAKVSFPYDDTPHRRIERLQKEPLTATGGWTPAAYGTPDQQYTTAILTGQTLLSQDDQSYKIYRVWEDLPGPVLVTSRIDPEDGSVITESRQTVLTSAAGPATASGTSSTRYEPRGDSSYVSIKITTTTALDGVVRSTPSRVNLRLPRVLAGVAVSYNVNKGTGDDSSTGAATGTGSRHDSASARSSSSLSVLPEVFTPIRDYSDAGEDFPATVKQVFLSGAITEANILTKLATVYEVVVSGTLSPAAGGTYLGNASNVNGVIWFSKDSTSRKLTWTDGVWKLGTDAEILAGNYWSLTAAATAWLGAYTPHGTNTGTLTVAVGRTVAVMPNWNTAEVNLITAGKQVSVSANASGNEEKTDTSTSSTLSAGKSVSVGGSQGRPRVEPTLHAAITIGKSTYTDSVNATAAAVLQNLVVSGIDSGFPSGTNPYGNTQFVTAYVRATASAATSTPAPLTISGNTVANPTIVHTSTDHGLVSGQVVTITGSDSSPTLNGLRLVTVTDASHFSVSVNVTVAGTTGSVQGPAVPGVTIIPATDPTDVPQSGLYMLPQYQTPGKDAIYTGVNATVVDLTNLATATTFIAYSDPSPSYPSFIPITPNQPYWLGGTPASWSISPTPGAMTFSATTGTLSGVPVAGTYTITAHNPLGNATTTLVIG